MSSKRAREGEIFIDHRSSPGLSDDVSRALGLPDRSLSEGSVLESATLTCCHCGSVYLKNPDRVRARGYCAGCDDYVCDNKACHDSCNPFAKKLDEMESTAYKEQQNNLSLRFGLT